VPVKLRKVQPVPRDESGKPIVPFKSGIITVHQLGEVVYDRKNFHSERYIYPVGYVSSRNYASMVSPTKSTRYVCSILDSGADGPRFQIVPDDAPQNIITAQSATGAWTAVLKGANAVRNRENSASASGPEYFGFSHPTVQSLIQELPGVERCANYVRQEY
ncbi:F/Y rich C-terminus-domain-containing protein, partial [Fimicolochytrium jonesii]|uniref:F/Y rich C-terminus-domain-containing protein n=1 Tax=Fimicolochytrium jonesii TaxID=1396493 RepID=UPI0022FECD8A